jgi:hypothetical protein
MRRRVTGEPAPVVTEATLWAALTAAGLAPTTEDELDDPSPELAAWLAKHGFDEIDLINASPLDIYGRTSSPEILITPETARVNDRDVSHDEAITASQRTR